MSVKSKQHGTDISPRVDEPRGAGVKVSDKFLTVTLRDGRVIRTPLAWYPKLHRATAAARAKWEWWGDGIGISWPALDEDLGICGMLAGNPSHEYEVRQRRQQLSGAHA